MINAVSAMAAAVIESLLVVLIIMCFVSGIMLVNIIDRLKFYINEILRCFKL